MESPNPELLLPAWRLAIFPPEGDGDGGGGDADQSSKGDQNGAGDKGGDKGGGGQQQQQRDQHRDDNRDRGGGNRDDRGGDRGQLRDDGGRYASNAEYERRITELNNENATRRRENSELKSTVSVIERRAIRSDATIALRDAGAISDRIVDLFLNDNAEHVKIDPKTGQTTGLDKLPEWKKANAAFFKVEQNDGDGDKGGEGKGADGKGSDGDKGAGDGKGGDGKGGEQQQQRGNRTAGGGSRGNGSGGEGTDTGGLPDLSTLTTAAERNAAIENYKRGLRGAGSTYAKASSKR